MTGLNLEGLVYICLHTYVVSVSPVFISHLPPGNKPGGQPAPPLPGGLSAHAHRSLGIWSAQILWLEGSGSSVVLRTSQC